MSSWSASPSDLNFRPDLARFRGPDALGGGPSGVTTPLVRLPDLVARSARQEWRVQAHSGPFPARFLGWPCCPEHGQVVTWRTVREQRGP